MTAPTEAFKRLDYFPRVDLSKVREVLPRITGANIEQRLIALAGVGGTQLPPRGEQPTRYATNRVALSQQDHAARANVIVPQLKEAGASEIIHHPLGVIGKFEGTNPSLAPLILLSHTDTVPNGDMYDGVYGVEAAIAATKAMTEAGIQPKRTILVISLTGEESAGFGIALFGSRAMFQGLTNAELDSKSAREGAKSIRETLLEQGVDITKVQQPIFGEGKTFSTPYAVLELHVDQSGDLEKKGLDIGVVEAIASPVRHRVVVGKPLEADHTTYPSTKYLELDIAGKAAHSGATPMGNARADGLEATSEVLREFLWKNMGHVSIGNISILGQAINKIPGKTKTTLRITGNSDEETTGIANQLARKVAEQNAMYARSDSAFDPTPVSLHEIDPAQLTTQFYKAEDIQQSQFAALTLVERVCTAALITAAKDSVGTVGTVRMDKGQFILELDIRGTDKSARDVVMREIFQTVESLNQRGIPVNLGKPLPGSGEDPVTLDPYLVGLADDTLKQLGIGESTTCISAAGHDAQNAQRAHAPTVMLFVPSHNGIAHNPDAYTDPSHLEKGAKALAAVMLRLAA